MLDRIDTICALLLGAAYADDHFHEREKQMIRELLSDLVDGDLPESVEARIEGFIPEGFDAAETAREFAKDPDANHRALLELIAAVHEADDEYDFKEDDYVRTVAEALGADASRLVLDYETEDLKQDLGKLRPSPPPIPGAAEETVDIDIDD